MDSGVLGLGAVAWTDAWNATGSESRLRLPVDPARLIELLHGMPVARALLTDLQRAASAGRSVELIVSPDRQVAEIATGSGHYLLTPAARNAVLVALIGRAQLPASIRETSIQRHVVSDLAPEATVASRPRPGGILWEVPSAAREPATSQAIALPWLAPAAYLEVHRDSAGGGSAPEPQSEVVCATLHLELPRLGRFDAHIRVCGSAVAVSIDCSGATRVEARLATLEQRLQAQGLVSAHVGIATSRSGP